MAEATSIEWCDSTFNPWVGCTKISPACDHCYAESWAKRSGMVKWGNEPRRRTSISNCREPLKWQREAEHLLAECERTGVTPPRRRRVFCASLADVFDNQVPDEWRHDLWSLIEQCWAMDWLLLTKRPQNIAKMLPDTPTWKNIRRHVWLGTTVEDQRRLALNVPQLLQHDAAVRFVSCEPLLGPLAMSNYLDTRCHENGHRLDWVIAGGESGPQARPSHPDWFRSLRDQCAAAGVPFLFKQWGEWTPGENVSRTRGSVRTAVWFNEDWFLSRENLANTEGHIDDEPDLYEMGKKAAGRFLDGVEHNGVPAL